MTVRVLVVDDSGFFRRRLTEILSADGSIAVVGTAANGREAIEQTLALRPDVITMDYEMPVMDGISAVRNIMQRCPTPVLMFSSLSHEGARITLDALDAGAMDYLPKNFSDISNNPQKVKQLLYAKIHSLAGSNRKLYVPPSNSERVSPAALDVKPAVSDRLARATARRAAATAARLSEQPAAGSTTPQEPLLAPREPVIAASKIRPKARPYQLVAIGTSTGGPVALQKVLTKLPASFPVPIVIIQHMPATFTRAFAERLNKLCEIDVKEAEEGDMLRPGLALLAPGGQQMMIGPRGSIRILPGDERLSFKPSVDVTFGSAAKVYNDKVLAVVLTGMGADGREGARLLKQVGSQVWAQDEASCVIYGMPMAVVKADLADCIYSLDDIAGYLIEACS